MIENVCSPSIFSDVLCVVVFRKRRAKGNANETRIIEASFAILRSVVLSFFFFYRRMKVSLRSIPAGACEIADSLCGYYRKCAFVAQDTRQRILKFKRRAPTDESVRFSVAVEPFLPESKTHLAFILF